MATFTPQTKNTATFVPETKNVVSTAFILKETIGYILLQNGGKFVLNQSAVGNVEWVPETKS